MSKLLTDPEGELTLKESDDFVLKDLYWPDALPCLRLLAELSEKNQQSGFSPARPLFVSNMNWRADIGQEIKLRREFFLPAGEPHLIWGSNGAARKIFLVKEGQVHLSDREGNYLCTLGPGSCYGRYYVSDSIGGRDLMEWPRLPFSVLAGDYPQDNSALLENLESKAVEELGRDPLIADLRAYFQIQMRTRLDSVDGEVLPTGLQNLQEQLHRAYLAANLAGSRRGATIISLTEEKGEDYARRFWSRIFYPTLSGYARNQMLEIENPESFRFAAKPASAEEKLSPPDLSADAWNLLFFLKTAYEFSAEPILQAYLPGADLRKLEKELLENGCIHPQLRVITGKGLYALDCEKKDFDNLSCFLFSYFLRTADWFNTARILDSSLKNDENNAEMDSLFLKSSAFQTFLLQTDNFLEGDLHRALLEYWLEAEQSEKQKSLMNALAAVAYYKQQDYPSTIDYAQKALSADSSKTTETPAGDTALTPKMAAQLLFLRKESFYTLNRYEEAAASSLPSDFNCTEQEGALLLLASKATALAITTSQKEALNQTMLALAEKMEEMAKNVALESLPSYFRLMICGEVQRLRLRGCKARKAEEFTENLQVSIVWGEKAKNLPEIKAHDLQPPFVNQALALERVGDFAGSISIMKEAAIKLVNPLTGEKYEAWARYLYNTAHLFGSRIETIAKIWSKSEQRGEEFHAALWENLTAIKEILVIISKEPDFCAEGETSKYAGIISKIEMILSGNTPPESEQNSKLTALDEVFYELWRLYFRINYKASRFADEHHLPYPAVITHANVTRSLGEIRSLISLSKKRLRLSDDEKSQDQIRDLEIHDVDAREKTAQHLQQLFLTSRENYWKRNFLNIRPLDEIFSHLIEYGLSLSKEMVDILNQMKAADIKCEMTPEIQDFAREAFGFRDSFLDFYTGLYQRAEALAKEESTSKSAQDFFTKLRQLRREIGILRRS